MPPELVTVDEEVVAVRIAGQEFPYESETGQASIPKKLLSGFRLSEIPEDLIIKPVESISGRYIKMKNDIGLSAFSGGSASAFVEVMQRRKFWDGEVGLSPYMEAFRQAIREHEDAEESDFQDDGDYRVESHVKSVRITSRAVLRAAAFVTNHRTAEPCDHRMRCIENELR